MSELDSSVRYIFDVLIAEAMTDLIFCRIIHIKL